MPGACGSQAVTSLGAAPHRICRMGMSRSFQHTSIFPRLTVFENVQAAYLAHRGRGANF